MGITSSFNIDRLRKQQEASGTNNNNNNVSNPNQTASERAKVSGAGVFDTKRTQDAKAAEKAAASNPFAAADSKQRTQQADAQNVDQNQFFNQNGDIPLENIYGDSGLSLSTHKDGGEKAANGKGDLQADAAGDKNNSNPLARFFGAGKAAAGSKNAGVAKTGDSLVGAKKAGISSNGAAIVPQGKTQAGGTPIIKNSTGSTVIGDVKAMLPSGLPEGYQYRSTQTADASGGTTTSKEKNGITMNDVSSAVGTVKTALEGVELVGKIAKMVDSSKSAGASAGKTASSVDIPESVKNDSTVKSAISDCDKADKDLADSNQAVGERTRDVETAESAFSKQEAEVTKTLNDEEKSMIQEKNQAQAKVDGFNQQITAKETEAKAEGEKAVAFGNKANTIRKTDMPKKQGEIDKTQGEINSLQSQITAAQKDGKSTSSLEQQLQTKQREKETKERELKTLEEQAKQAEADQKTAEKAQKTAQDAANSIKNGQEYKDANQKLQESNTKIENNPKVKAAEAKLTECRAKVSTAKNNLGAAEGRRNSNQASVTTAKTNLEATVKTSQSTYEAQQTQQKKK